MRPAAIWFSLGGVMVMVSGVIGDAVFCPHPPDFSFRVMSSYAVSILLLLAACVTLNMRK